MWTPPKNESAKLTRGAYPPLTYKQIWILFPMFEYQYHSPSLALLDSQFHMTSSMKEGQPSIKEIE